jgi:hypothetical protein
VEVASAVSSQDLDMCRAKMTEDAIDSQRKIREPEGGR